MKAAIVDVTTGELVSERHRIPTPQPATPVAVARTFKQLVGELNWIGPVGCCFPTVIKKGKSTSHGNLSPEWLGVQVDELFENHCPDANVFVANDAELAGIAEMRFGAGKGKSGSVVLLTVGTGIGSVLFYDGNLIPNLELGHVYYTDGRIYEKYVADSARKRDGLSLKGWARRFDGFLHHVDTICSPDLFIIGGGISRKFEKYQSHFTVSIPIVPAEFKNNAGIVGAAIYAAERSENSVRD
jgi:polyphosphate glucokinase